MHSFSGAELGRTLLFAMLIIVLIPLSELIEHPPAKRGVGYWIALIGLIALALALLVPLCVDV
jgi:hypothetical protein